MRCDYVLIIFIFIYICYHITITISYFKYSGKRLEVEKKYTLTKFQDIEINEFELPNDFKTLKDEDKRKYVYQHKNDYKVKISSDIIKLITLINYFRKKNNTHEFNYSVELPYYKINYILNYFSENFYFDSNIFKITNKNYLFKFPIGEFEKKLYNEDKNIIDILLKDYLDNIFIFKQGNFDIIYIYNEERSQIKVYPEENEEEKNSAFLTRSFLKRYDYDNHNHDNYVYLYNNNNKKYEYK